MHWDTNSTIAAVATGRKNALRGAVRIAGPDTRSILLDLFPSSQTIIQNIDHQSRPARFTSHATLFGEHTDIPVDVFFWPTHRSYTGSPAAELHTIGNRILLDRLLNQVCSAGARLAEPGEFTFRAFLAGRLDLTQCEAVLGAIDAQSSHEFDVALKQLAGGISGPLESIRIELINLLADLEAGLDFVDEDIEFVSREDLLERLNSAKFGLLAIERQLQSRRVANASPQVVLLGQPNAGKSSLLNVLAGTEVALVHSMPGTTRDFVRATVELEHGTVDLLDTAGVFDDFNFEFAITPASAETQPDVAAQMKAIDKCNESDLLFACVDASLPIDTIHQHLAHVAKILKQTITHESGKHQRDTRERWIIWTKSDLFKSDSSSPHTDKHLLQPLIDSLGLGECRQFDVSSHCHIGIDGLLEALNKWSGQRNAESSEVVPATSVRCHQALFDAMTAVDTALQLSYGIGDEELIAGELRLALDCIGRVAGTVYTDDILDALFSRFCIGK